MLRNLDVVALRAFVAIVDRMSFSKAGEDIGRSQSAVSLRLRQLEEAVGTTLLVRRQGKVFELTPSGRSLVDYARQIIELNDRAFRDVTRKTVPSRIRLGVPADFLDARFPEALAEIRSRFGGLELDVETDVSARLRDRCLAGDLDAAFYKTVTPDEVGTPLGQRRLGWVAGATFAPVPGEPLSMVCCPEGCAHRSLMERCLREAGIAYRIAVTTSSCAVARKAVAVGLGISAFPDYGRAGPPMAGLPEPGSYLLNTMVASTADSATRDVVTILSKLVPSPDREWGRLA